MNEDKRGFNRIYDGMAAKISMYIVMLIMSGIAAASIVGVVLNIANSWYSAPASQAEEDIYGEVARNTKYSIDDALNESEHEWIIDEEYFREEPLITGSDELISGETGSEQFGYSIYLLSNKDGEEKSQLIHKSNDGIAESARTYKYVDTIWEDDESGDALVQEKIEIYLGDLDKGGVPGEIRNLYDFYQGIYKYRVVAAVAAIVGVIASVIIFICLICAAGRNSEKDGFIKRIPVDLAFAAAAFLIVLVVAGGAQMMTYDYIDEYMTNLGYLTGIVVGTIALGTGAILILAAQAKERGWWKNTVLCVILRMIKKLCLLLFAVFGKAGLVWKTGLLVLAGLLLNIVITIIMISDSYGGPGFIGIALWAAGAVTVSALVIYMALCMKRLKDGGRRLAEGDLGYKVNEDGLFLDLKEHAHDLNEIGGVISKAVEERMKSERFKAELITNVSHDIKTPLTSIINYVDFLKKEEIDSENAKEYIDILDRQSQRLKKLTEDLVEASKAATGNVSFEPAPCNIGVMMSQMNGEYEEKLKDARLEVLTEMPEDDINIMIDGRSLWRVFDNLLSNICKYSQPDTRVYQTLAKAGGRAVVTYKNISKYELNISGEELTERFVRGDNSRHSEGSGLGLSIARNLVELQGGSFDIHIDGDLFKVVMKFEII